MLLEDQKPKPGTHFRQTAVCFSPVEREEMVAVTEISSNRAMSAWGPEGQQELVRVSVKSAQMPPAEETPALSPELTVQVIGAPSRARPGLQRGRLQPSGHLQRPGRRPRDTERRAEQGRGRQSNSSYGCMGQSLVQGDYSFPIKGWEVTILKLLAEKCMSSLLWGMCAK